MFLIIEQGLNAERDESFVMERKTLSKKNIPGPGTNPVQVKSMACKLSGKKYGQLAINAAKPQRQRRRQKMVMKGT